VEIPADAVKWTDRLVDCSPAWAAGYAFAPVLDPAKDPRVYNGCWGGGVEAVTDCEHPKHYIYEIKTENVGRLTVLPFTTSFRSVSGWFDALGYDKVVTLTHIATGKSFSGTKGIYTKAYCAGAAAAAALYDGVKTCPMLGVNASNMVDNIPSGKWLLTFDVDPRLCVKSKVYAADDYQYTVFTATVYVDGQPDRGTCGFTYNASYLTGCPRSSYGLW
jgi:hypothetical protein